MRAYLLSYARSQGKNTAADATASRFPFPLHDPSVKQTISDYYSISLHRFNSPERQLKQFCKMIIFVEGNIASGKSTLL